MLHLLVLFLCLQSAVGLATRRSNLSLLAIYTSPTSVSSDFPSLVPSQQPSSAPILTNRWAPPLGVILPTTLPTTTPSISPSSAPSPSCHDMATYKSPLNNFQCHDHAGTDCFQWRFLGLSAREVETLVTSCPATCNIECGMLYSFEVQSHFRLLNVDNFLAPESTRTFQQASADYLTRFLQPKAFDNRFLIHEVELLSQRQPDTENRSIRRRLQGYLDVSVAFRGFAVGLNYAIVEALLMEGLESPGYGIALQMAGDDALNRARISFNIQEELPSEQPVVAEVSSNSTSFAWIVVAIMIVALMVLSCVIFQYFRHMNTLKNKAMESTRESNFPVEIDAMSPIASSIGQLSFDGVLHIMSSYSTKSAVSSEDVEAPPVTPIVSRSYSQSSECSEDPAAITENMHPLTGIIPQMIVYRGIDDEDDDASTATEVKLVVPSKVVNAPPSLLAALFHGSACDSFMDTSVYDGIFQDCDRRQDEGLALLARSASRETTFSSDENADPKGQISIPTPNRNESSLTPSDQKMEMARSPLRNVLASRMPASDSSLPSLEHTRHPLLAVRSGTKSLPDELATVSSLEPLNNPEHTRRNDSGSQGSLVQTMMGMSPRKLRKPPPPPNPSTSLPENPITMETRTLFSRKRSKSNASESSGELGRTTEDWDQFVFQAPRKGKLGLVIQCDHYGPIVTQVKDYSPLLGQVLRGDRIMEIDNRCTTGMNLKDVTGLLGGRASVSNRWLSVFRIVVRRPGTSVDTEELFANLGEASENVRVLSGTSSSTGATTDFRPRPLAPRSQTTPPRHPLLRSSSDPMTQQR